MFEEPALAREVASNVKHAPLRVDAMKLIERLLSVCALLALLASCAEPLSREDAGSDGVIDGGDANVSMPDAGFTCEPGQPGCFGRSLYVCGEDGRTREDEVVCDAACDPAGGCVPCVPDARICDGSISMVCNAEGTGWRYGRDCAEWGSSCMSNGFCDDPCATAEAARTYLGCEYLAAPFAQTAELDRRRFEFVVVVANPNAQAAEVSIYRGPRLYEKRRIVPGGLEEIALPWVDGLSFPTGEEWSSATIEDGAYRVRSTRPVIVSQFNPFEYASFEGGIAYSYTNDASLLLPVHALGRDHVAASYLPTSSAGGSSPPWIAVVGASREPTRVEIVASAPILADANGRFAATQAGGTLTFTLAEGEVAQLIAAPPPPCDATRPGYADGLCREPEYDLTGSRITADRPIAVFSGHVCAFVPYDTRACDHLETQLAPVPAWGKRYETMPLIEPGTSVGNLVRVIAAEDDTRITFDPDLERVTELTLAANEHRELLLTGPVSIEADRPIQVAQLMLGQESTDPPLERGDPALTMLVPSEQFRSDYVFVTPSSYADTPSGRAYVLISRAPGGSIVIDGTPLDATWTRVGDRELAIVELDGGTHHAEGPTPFGLIAFGLGTYTSYACPAGLNLNTLL